VKIYLAAPYPTRDRCIEIMHVLEAAGHVVTSRWLKAPDELNDAFAREDLADVMSADLLLAYNPLEFENAGTGGRHIEFGYAIAKHKKLALIGNRSNIFHYLSDVKVYETVEEFVAMNVIPPVDRSQRVSTSGNPLTEDHRELDPRTGMQKDYVVLSAEERAKGFVRPVRSQYKHLPCGTTTWMATSLAETYARDPQFYSGTFCSACKVHKPLDEFEWMDGTKVGS